MNSKPTPLLGRRKGPRQLPSLPLSAFTPPNSGTSDKFPLPPSPSTVHPENVVDAHVVGDPELEKWQKEVGETLGSRAYGVIMSTTADEAKDVPKEKGGVKILSLMIPFVLDDPASIHAAAEAANNASVPVSFSTVFSKSTEETTAALQEVLRKGRPVDIDIQTSSLTDASFEGLEDFLTKATEGLEAVPPIILSNFLPPPHDSDLQLVQLMNHARYRSFQAHTAALSLFPSIHIKYLPPAWDQVATPSNLQSGSTENSGVREQREWKRRIKMYLGPVMEAFGFERIIFGSSSPAGSQAPSNSGEWYNMDREALAELGVEQEYIDGVFSLNAQRAYGLK